MISIYLVFFYLEIQRKLKTEKSILLTIEFFTIHENKPLTNLQRKQLQLIFSPVCMLLVYSIIIGIGISIIEILFKYPYCCIL